MEDVINKLCLFDTCRGFIYAIAHVRGGGDLGQYWYLDGKMLNKNNTFLDLIAAAQLLIAVRPSQLHVACMHAIMVFSLTAHVHGSACLWYSSVAPAILVERKELETCAHDARLG